MSEYRIVYNKQSGLFRVEQRRWWGWNFVMDESGEDYLSFADCRDAQRFVCRKQRQQGHRRWRVIGSCSRSRAGC